MKIGQKYFKTLAGYVRWAKGNFLSPKEVRLEITGPSPEEAMYLWESRGIVPTSCSDPGTLAVIVQAKRSRDFHITEWRKSVSEGLFVPEEFFGCSGMKSAEEFKSVFGRLPNIVLVKRQLWLVRKEIEEYENILCSCVNESNSWQAG